MTNTKKYQKVRDLVNQIAITVGKISNTAGTEKEREKLREALAFADAFAKEEEETEDEDYQGSDNYYQSNC